jgi:hypothetical protein
MRLFQWLLRPSTIVATTIVVSISVVYQVTAGAEGGSYLGAGGLELIAVILLKAIIEILFPGLRPQRP